MKKLLALVLALVMVMGLSVVSTNAAYTDAEKIDHTEAVDVLGALKVLEGFPDGSFKPEGDVTRAQMAKMIAIILLGSDADGAAFTGSSSDLKDIDGHWAEGYIKFCVSQKIVAGYGDGTFLPDKNVTTAEASKMLLTALGYNAEVQEYTGANWSINVIRDAQYKKLLEDLAGMTANKAITREEAAQMIYNTIQRGMIIKSADQTRDNEGKITDSYVDTDLNGQHITLLNQTFDAVVLKGTFDGNYATGAGNATNEGWIQFTAYNTAVNDVRPSKNAGVTRVAGASGFAYDFDIANIGEEVKVIYRNTANSITNRPDRYDEIFGVFKTGATQVLNTTVDKISRTAQTDPAKLKIDGTAYECAAAGGTVYTNFDMAGATFAAATATTAAGFSTNLRALNFQNPNTFTGDDNDTQKTDEIKLVFDDDGKIINAYVTAYAMTHLTSVTSDKVSLAGVATIEKKDNEVYDGAAADDVVVWTAVGDPAGNGFYIVKKAETIEGKVDGYAALNNVAYQKAISVDGTKYNIYDYVLVDVDTDDVVTNLYDADSKIVGKTVRLYMINGAVGAVDLLDDTEFNWGLVLAQDGTGTGVDPYKVQLLLGDGSKKIYEVYEKSDKKVIAAGDLYDLVKFNVRSDGTINISAIATTDGNQNTNNDADDGSRNAALTTIWNADTKKAFNAAVAASDCVLFVDTTTNTGAGTWKAYSIRNLKTMTLGTGRNAYWATNTSGQVVVGAVYAGQNASGGSNNTKYAIVTARNGNTTLGGDPYSAFTVYDGKDSYMIYLEGANIAALSTGDLVTFDQTSDNKYAAADVTALDDNGTTVLDVAVDKYDKADNILTYYTGVTANGTIPETYTGAAKDTKAVDKDVEIIYVNEDDETAGDNIGVTKFDTLTGYANAKLICDDDGVVTAIIVETSRKCNVNGGTAVASAVITAGTTDTGSSIEGNLTTYGAVTMSGNTTLATDKLDVDNGQTLTIDGDLNTNSQTLTVKAGGKLIVTGDVTTAAGNLVNDGGTIVVRGTSAVAALTHNAGTTELAGALTTLTLAKAGTVKTAGAITTVTDTQVAADGTLVIDGTVTNVTDVTNTGTGKTTFKKNVTGTVTDISSGTVVFEGTVGTVTDISSSTGSVTFEGDVTALAALSGTTTVNIKATVTETAAATLGAATVKVFANGEWKLGSSTNAIDISAVTLQGENGAKITLAASSSGVTVAANQLFKTDGTTETAGALTVDTTADTYTYGAKIGTMPSAGFAIR